jgi:histidinol-phosphatase (PHP family)
MKIKERFLGRIKILYGIELGQIHFDMELSKKILKRNDFDFVIGSVHNLMEDKDLYAICYTGENTSRVFLNYLDQVKEMAKIGDFDVLGHLTYPLRYCIRDGQTLRLDDYMEQITEILRIIIQRGKGIEINVSGLRHIMSQPMPSFEILALYKKLGGEIITVGSDAHRAEHVGVLIPEGYHLLKKAGFDTITVYEKRKPKKIKFGSMASYPKKDF